MPVQFDVVLQSTKIFILIFIVNANMLRDSIHYLRQSLKEKQVPFEMLCAYSKYRQSIEIWLVVECLLRMSSTISVCQLSIGANRIA